MEQLRIPIRNVFGRKQFLVLLCFTLVIWQVLHTSVSLNDFRDCGCDKCLTDDHPWFMQHFQRNVSLFLTNNYSLSREAFNWWRELQYAKGGITFFKKTTYRLLKLFPGRPPAFDHGPDLCRTCAVVGNSGNLLRSHYGKLIDLHDFVFRINLGETKGYEEDVGNRTTHRVMYPESAMDLDNSTHLLMFPFKTKDLQWLVGEYPGTLSFVKKRITMNNNLVTVVNPAFMNYVHASWLQRRWRYPSTGFMTLILALHLCDEVSVFGFGADRDGNWNHYWEVLKNNTYRTGPHPISAEYAMIEELAKQGKINFYRGL